MAKLLMTGGCQECAFPLCNTFFGKTKNKHNIKINSMMQFNGQQINNTTQFDSQQQHTQKEVNIIEAQENQEEDKGGDESKG